MGKAYVIIISPTAEETNSMPMLTGEYNHQLDAKNRMRIPAKLRKELGDEFFFAKGTDGCLFVYPKAEVEAILEKLKYIPLGDPRQRNVRAFLKTILSVKEDDHGRLLLSPEMREHIGLGRDDKDLIVCGAGTRVEIWSQKTYDSYFGEDDTDYDTLVKNLGI